MTSRPIRISINALGGQGGGMLADWIVAVAEQAGWVAQATSVPGVAQRTGATVYYIEICPPVEREPVLALMPFPGDVDIVIALELMEAGRAIARGLVTPDRTTLIASVHRIFAIAEKSARGDGAFSSAAIIAACERVSKRLVLADFEHVAQRHDTMISASAFGALAGAGVLPFEVSAFRSAMAASGRNVTQNLAAFDDALSGAAVGEWRVGPETGATSLPSAREGREFPTPVQQLADLGASRVAAYQGAAYAALYMARLARICAAEAQLGPTPDWRFSREAARHLALWMTYEDMIRVAELKLTRARFARVAAEARAGEGAIVRIVDFMHPRFEEVCDVLPRWLGEGLADQHWARRAFAALFERDWKVPTSRLRGFMMLALVASLRPVRPASRRYVVEQERIESWLASAVNAARTDYALGVEILRLQRLVRGYSDTYERGVRCFSSIMNLVPHLAGASDAATRVRALHEAALQDDDAALATALSAEAGLSVRAPVPTFSPPQPASS